MSSSTNQITTSGYSYDASGNMTNDGSNTFVYDGESRATSANSGNAAYTYDGNGVRVQKAISGGTTTAYVFSGGRVIAEYEGSSPSAGSPTREYIYSGGQLTAKIEGSNTSYYHQDSLSVRLLTDSSGGNIGEQGLFPFGETWYANNTTTKWKFTSYERDNETGNDYAMARSYIGRLGRFNSPDPVGGDVSNPQSLNRYAYVTNDPINGTDPTGLDPCDASQSFCCLPGDPICCDLTLDSEVCSGFPGGGCEFGDGDCGPYPYFPLPPPPPPFEPVGDPSLYGTWDESIPGGVQPFPPPFGGISFPSDPSGCTYGSGSCGGMGGMIYGLTTDANGNVIGSFPWESWCQPLPGGSCINVVWDPVEKIWMPSPKGHPQSRPRSSTENESACKSTENAAKVAGILALASMAAMQEELAIPLELVEIYYHARILTMGCPAL